ncbi:Protein of unknown function [Gryllus bimaculatus]|nr:Protein of unknown function [Gryllus bimaculatus]
MAQRVRLCAFVHRQVYESVEFLSSVEMRETFQRVWCAVRVDAEGSRLKAIWKSEAVGKSLKMH